MFARAATRTFVRPAVAPVLGRRAASTAATPAKSNPLIQAVKEMPVDVYPLAFCVGAAVVGSVYMCGYHLITDKHLRLKPTGNAGTSAH